jgi:hypothetical protein
VEFPGQSVLAWRLPRTEPLSQRGPAFRHGRPDRYRVEERLARLYNDCDRLLVTVAAVVVADEIDVAVRIVSGAVAPGPPPRVIVADGAP